MRLLLSDKKGFCFCFVDLIYFPPVVVFQKAMKKRASCICFWRRKDMNFWLFFHQSQKNCLFEFIFWFFTILTTRKMFCLTFIKEIYTFLKINNKEETFFWWKWKSIILMAIFFAWGITIIIISEQNKL